jgi:hypothetical protein
LNRGAAAPSAAARGRRRTSQLVRQQRPDDGGHHHARLVLGAARVRRARVRVRHCESNTGRLLLLHSRPAARALQRARCEARGALRSRGAAREHGGDERATRAADGAARRDAGKNSDTSSTAKNCTGRNRDVLTRRTRRDAVVHTLLQPRSSTHGACRGARAARLTRSSGGGAAHPLQRPAADAPPSHRRHALPRRRSRAAPPPPATAHARDHPRLAHHLIKRIITAVLALSAVFSRGAALAFGPGMARYR